METDFSKAPDSRNTNKVLLQKYALVSKFYFFFSCTSRSNQGNEVPPSLTLRRLMSYIYMEHPFLMFLDHTQRRSTVGRTPLDE